MMSIRETASSANIEETRKVERITNEMIEANLIRCSYFHGFVLQELQLILLKTRGDFLLRLSHQPERKEAKSKKAGSNTEVLPLTRVILVLSVNVTCQKMDITKSVYGDLDEKKQKENVDFHVTIEETSGKWTAFYIERRLKFASIDDLISYYKANPIIFKATNVKLIRAIPLQAWELKGQSIDLTPKKLGEGAYGDVYLGRWKEPFCVERKEFYQWCDVAVKTMKNTDSRAALMELMHEARLQLQLKHKNVLAFRGVFLLKKPILLVSEFCELGSLKDHLQKSKVDVDEKLRFCVGSACGLEYIHFKGLIHRDLATRNILVSADKTPKIADFGLAKCGMSYTMRRSTKIPIRYLAPETISSFLYSTKTDVYTFGLVIWEIFHNGQEPYTKAQPHQEKAVSKNVPMKGRDVKELIKKELFVRFNAETPAALQKYVSAKLFVTDETKRPVIGEVTTFLASLAKMDISKDRAFYTLF
uniref:Tyrosine-protein kinase n=1 Tax=Caenorhabditis japonica TaxID=281687 RepID=A0A8R1DVD9_CAEJA